MPDLEQNKANAIAFYDPSVQPMPPAAGDRAIRRGAIYSAQSPSRRCKQPFIDYFDKMTRDFPGKRVEVKRAIAEGNLVVLHCRQEWPGSQIWAGIDIFRFDNAGKIVEHWDVLQIVPDTAAHSNGMF